MKLFLLLLIRSDDQISLYNNIIESKSKYNIQQRHIYYNIMQQQLNIIHICVRDLLHLYISYHQKMQKSQEITKLYEQFITGFQLQYIPLKNELKTRLLKITNQQTYQYIINTFRKKYCNLLQKSVAILKIILIQDLTNLNETIFNFKQTCDYVDKIYKVIHVTNEDSKQLVQHLTQKNKYKLSNIAMELLNFIISRHLQIRYEILTNRQVNENEMDQKYGKIVESIQHIKLQLYIGCLLNDKIQFMKDHPYYQLLKKIIKNIRKIKENYIDFQNLKCVHQIQQFKKSLDEQKDFSIIQFLNIGIKICFSTNQEYIYYLNMILFQVLRSICEDQYHDINSLVKLQNFLSFNYFTISILRKLWAQLYQKLNEQIFSKSSQLMQCKQYHKINIKQIDCINIIFNKFDLLFISFILNNQNLTFQTKHKKRILIIGKTKCGKSSFLKFLTKNQQISVSHDPISQTFIPNYVSDIHQNYSVEYWDLPGFNDHRSTIHRCANSYIHKKLMSQHDNIKIVYLINIDDCPKKIHDLNRYCELFNNVGENLDWNRQCLNSLILVLTNVQSAEKKSQVINFLRINSNKISNLIKQKFPSSIEFQQQLRKKLINSLNFYQTDIDIRDTLGKYKNPNPQFIKNYNKKRNQHSHQIKQLIYNSQRYQSIKFSADLFLEEHEINFLKMFKIEEQILNLIQRSCSRDFRVYINIEEQDILIKLYKTINMLIKLDNQKITRQIVKQKMKYIQQYKSTLEHLNELQQIYINKKITNKKGSYEQLIKNNLKIFFNDIQKVNQQQLQNLFKDIVLVIENSYVKLKHKLENIQKQKTLSPIRKSIKEFVVKIKNYGDEKKKQNIQQKPIFQNLKNSSFKYKQSNSKHKHQLLKCLKSKQEKHLVQIIEYFLRDYQDQEFYSLFEIYLMDLLNQKVSKIQTIYKLMYRLNISNFKKPSYYNKFDVIKFRNKFFESVTLSQFLRTNSLDLNSIQQSEIYQILQNEIVINCGTIIFDKPKFIIMCRSLTINAKNILIPQYCSITVQKNNKPGSLIINSEQKYSKQNLNIANFQSYKKIVISKEELLNKFKQELLADYEIVSFSQKCQQKFHFTGLFEYNPPILYVTDKYNIKNQKYIIKYNELKFKKSANDFGVLYLVQRVKALIWNEKQKINEINQQNINRNINDIANNIIEYFKERVIIITQKNINSNLFGGIPQIIFNHQKSKSSQNIFALSLKQIKYNIRKILIQNTFKNLIIDYAKTYDIPEVIKKSEKTMKKIKKICTLLLNQKSIDVNYDLMDNFQKYLVILISLSYQNWFKINNFKKNRFNLIQACKYLYQMSTNRKFSIQSINDPVNFIKQQQLPKQKQILSSIYQQVSRNSRNMIEQRNDIMKGDSIYTQKTENQQYQLIILRDILEKNEFEYARQLILQIDQQEIESQNLIKLYKVLRTKYPIIYKLSLKSQIQSYKQPSLSDYIKQCKQQFQIFQFKNQFIPKNKIYLQDTYNIISFDGGQFQNNRYIVNLMMAAQIQKYTHRPIRDIFHFVIGQTNASVIASLLCISDQKSNPLFPAYQLLQEVCKLDTNFQSYQKYYQNCKCGYNQLDLGLISGQTKYAMNFFKEKFNIFDIVKKFKTNKTIYEENLLKYFNNQIPNKNKIVLSLGSGISYKNRIQQPAKSIHKWQVYINNQIDMKKASKEFYIDQTRLWIEQKWINHSSEMRKFLDMLQDQPSLNYFKA